MRMRRFAALFALVVAAPAAAQTQTGTVTGLVTDQETGQPMVGVQISISGTRLGQVTNEAGRYLIINVPVGTHTVSAQFLGYSEAEQRDVDIAAGGTATVDFTLSQTVLTLEEVVVTGVTDPIAGVKVPFSIGKVTRQNLATVPTTNSAAASIQGKVAGVSVVRGSGQPGAGVSVQLRTPTSYYGNTSPMYVVDGVILGSTFDGTTVDLESLDIESVEVVKGAAAASLYGSRAASGVISITTSRGRGLQLNDTRITVRSELGQSAAPIGLPRANAHYFRQNEQGQFLNASGGIARGIADRVIEDDEFMDNAYLVPTYDNVGAFFEPGLFNTNSVSLSHNSTSTNFLFSVNNYNEAGSLTGNAGFIRNNLRMNLDHRLGDNLTLAASAFHSRSKQDDSPSSFFNLFLYAPEVNLGQKDEQGRYVQLPDSTVLTENPLWTEQSRFNTDRRSRTLLNVDSRFTPFHWLNFDATVSYDRADLNNEDYTPKGTPTSVEAEEFSDGDLRIISEYTDAVNTAASANLLFNVSDLTLRTTLRGIMEREKNRVSDARGRDLFVVGVPDLSVAERRDIASSLQEIRANGMMVQQGVDYAGKYIGDFLIRRDGSSLFGPDARWNNYYRAALSYRMSQEPWWPFPAINEFKLRASRGTAGGRPDFTDQYETWAVSATGQVSKETLGNRNLKPEHTTEHEVGIDLIALNRYSLELTYARSVTRDQLIAAPLPSFYGYINQNVNAGRISGTTYEATFQAQLINRPAFSWQTTLIADRSRGRIEEWPRSCFFDDLRQICDDVSLSDMWGESLVRSAADLPGVYASAADEFDVNDDGYLVWVGEGNTYEDGLWGTTSLIDGRPVRWGMPILQLDEEGFPVQQRIGTSQPDVNIGWLNNIAWRNFSLHTHWHAQVGGDTYNHTKQRMYQHQRHADLDQTGKDEELKKPFAYYLTVYNQANNTDAFVEDGAYLKLRAVSLSYRFSRDQLSRLGLGGFAEGLSLGLTGRNLLTFDNYSGFDPEVGSVLERLDNFDYPNTRTITAMIEVVF
jgi:TonB-linked SusC/RagA family outer membrane protein